MATRLKFPFMAEARKLFDPELVNKAQRQSITKIKNKAKTRISRVTRSIYNVSAAKLNAALKMTTIERGQLRAVELEFFGRKIGLINFGAKFKRVRTVGKSGRFAGKTIHRAGATAKTHKNERRKLRKGGFIAPGANANIQVFERIDSDDPKSKIRKVTGPAIPQMVGQPEVVQAFEDLVDAEYPNIFESQINFLLSRSG